MHYSRFYNPLLFVGLGVLLAGLCALIPGKYFLTFTLPPPRGHVAFPMGVVLGYFLLGVCSLIALLSAVHIIRGIFTR